jgi:hypothetical protein
MRLVGRSVSEHAEPTRLAFRVHRRKPYRAVALATRIRCTVIVLTPVSAAICRIDIPLLRSRKTRSGSTAALGLSNTLPCARPRLRLAWTRSEGLTHSCIAAAARMPQYGVPERANRAEKGTSAVRIEATLSGMPSAKKI